MLFDFLSEAITNVSIIADEVKSSSIIAPLPEYRPVWDDEEGKIKFKEKKRPFFDPRQY